MTVPAGWKKLTLEELVSPKVGIKRGPFGGALKKEIFVSSGYCVYEQSNAIYNNFDEFRYFITAEKFKQMAGFAVQEGDFIVSCSGTIGQIARVPSTFREGVINQALLRIRLNGQLDPIFFLNLFRSDAFQKAISDTTQGGAMKNMVGMAEFRATPIVIPSIEEQKAIAAVLSTWDRAIEKTEALIEAKERRKAGLMQRLLTGKVRFGEEWEFPKAEDLFRNVSVKGFSEEPVLSVTQDQGVVFRDALERKINMSKDNTHTYKLVDPGDFIISLRSFQGGLEYSAIRGTVSPAYHVIRPKKPIVDAFYKHYFKSYEFIGRLAVAVIGIRDGKQISYGDFSFMKLPYPPVEQQEKIARILDQADEELNLERRNLAALKEQKKGLMQQLLTGKVRVKS
jgi:type I restriction enzyme S subunit